MQQLIFSLALAIPYEEGRVTQDRDACDVQVGCVLLQKETDKTTRKAGFGPAHLPEH